jgi:tripartite ATP-independent transporter DctP family solute receptor
LDVKLYPANALGEERDVYEGLQIGSGASCVISGSAILNNFSRRIGVLDLPYLWKDYDHVHKVLDGKVGEILAADLEKSGLHALVWMDSWGYRNIITSKKDVRKPEDLKGLKIRTIQSPVYVASLNMLGVNATPMAVGEVYTGIQTGVLDGFEHGMPVMTAGKYDEVCKHVALTRHCFGPLVFVYSKKEWDKLTDAEKKVVTEGALLARDVQRGLAPIRDAEATADLRKKGVQFTEIDTSGFRKKAIGIQDEIARERGATDLLKIIRAAE